MEGCATSRCNLLVMTQDRRTASKYTGHAGKRLARCRETTGRRPSIVLDLVQRLEFPASQNKESSFMRYTTCKKASDANVTDMGPEKRHREVDDLETI